MEIQLSTETFDSEGAAHSYRLFKNCVRQTYVEYSWSCDLKAKGPNQAGGSLKVSRN